MSGTAVVEAPTPKVVDTGGQRLIGRTGPEGQRIETIPPTAEAEISPVDKVCGMGSDRRLAVYEEGMFTLCELTIWAARFPDEVPLINGEFPWIALTLADLD